MVVLLILAATLILFLASDNFLANRKEESPQRDSTEATKRMNVKPQPDRKQVTQETESVQAKSSGESTQDEKLQEHVKLATTSSIDIKMNETRLGSKTKVSVHKWENTIIELSLKHTDRVIIKGNIEKKIIALTFDDGPERNITPKVIDVLNKYKVKGTFFFEGGLVKNNTDIVKKAFLSGHQIAGHSYSHPQFTRISKEQVQSEVSKTNQLINKAIGKTPLFLRPPYGDIDESCLSALDEEYKSVIWSMDTFDWVNKTKASEISRFVIDAAEPGDIILMHSSSGKQETLKAVPLIIEGLKKKGYEFVTVSEMLGEEAYK